ncbi:hypothetical protein HYH03_013585 [Edaphochlamys debaryana]|uniref:Uncharacterized protein n=1 Tax=Edaphochlamys debaryana TaxID=47281 RepID=A0A836BT93_9CHLO|nr:hypothetical protein HYH03_013585 [Edaphochlamys debaryana]|eukprot:KAG2487872.1 hypothetical protein HYH03_013585 [Edaphochlamys debaryana]
MGHGGTSPGGVRAEAAGALMEGPGRRKPLVYKEHWTAALADQAQLFSVQLVCSGGSGAVARTVVAPLERIKILRQVQHMAAVEGAVRYRGALDVLRRLPGREGGLQCLWRGNGANVLRLFPDVAFRFAIHDQFRVMFAPMDGSPPGIQEKLAAGAATGILKTALLYPLDLCRTRITADQSIDSRPAAARAAHPGPAAAAAAATATAEAAGAARAGGGGAPAGPAGPTTSAAAGTGPGAAAGPGGPGGSAAAGPGRTYPTVRSCLVQTLRTEGVRGLYRGALLSCGGVAPYLAISFTMYDELRRRLPSDRESTSSLWYPLVKMGCGAAAAVSAQTVVYPLDTVRRCMQMNGAAGTAVSYQSAWHCAATLVRSHGGIRALYRGCLTNALKTSLGAPVHFIMYDALKSAVQALDPTTGVSSPL